MQHIVLNKTIGLKIHPLPANTSNYSGSCSSFVVRKNVVLISLSEEELGCPRHGLARLHFRRNLNESYIMNRVSGASNYSFFLVLILPWHIFREAVTAGEQQSMSHAVILLQLTDGGILLLSLA